MDLRRVSLGAVVVGYLTSRGASKSLDVVWLSPVEGTVFNPGDTVVAKWTSSSVLVSPGFRLCTVSLDEKGISSGALKDRGEKKDDDETESEKCGVAIWPQVRQAEDGYVVTITAPEAMLASKYSFEMQDDFGNVFTSPVFELGGVSSNKAPMSSWLATSASSSSPALETAKDSGNTVKRSATFSRPSSTSLTTNNSAVDPPRFGIPTMSPQSLPSIQPDILVSRRPVSTAAIAVPLSVVSGIILVAGVMGYRARRALAKDRKRELRSLTLSQKNSNCEGYGSVGDVQRAISVLSSRKGYSGYSSAPGPPPFATKPEPRLVTRDPYNPMMTSASSGSIYDLHVPAPHYAGSQGVGRGKSLTAQYTAVGTVPRSEDIPYQTLSFSASNSDIPPSLLPARMSPLHIRSESPGGDRPLPMPPPPITCLSPSGSTNVYDAIAARLKAHQ
ncbi:hypothetical protein D9756_004345 [Leucocoprinus leucothites]|uniref:Uncharacterized protein n=1 Tax=Leucocoprinus leucothites TaxID=201217 RepID=A0A8H5DBG1_9AGAR|nr:hypothetical protein D9756_004345 [Leucoagaricus leucothites]